MDISGINLGGINPGEDGRETSHIDEISKQAQEFNPGAQVIPAAQHQAAAKARFLKDIEDKDETKESNEDVELEVATLGLIKLDEKQLKEFEERVEAAIYRQEQEIKDAINTFAGSEKTLRQAIGSVLLAS